LVKAIETVDSGQGKPICLLYYFVDSITWSTWNRAVTQTKCIALLCVCVCVCNCVIRGVTCALQIITCAFSSHGVLESLNWFGVWHRFQAVEQSDAITARARLVRLGITRLRRHAHQQNATRSPGSGLVLRSNRKFWSSWNAADCHQV
jgi:hypothetical protein